MKPRAVNTVTDGCAIVIESSETVGASASNDHDTPAAETPFHAFVLTSTCRAIVRNGLSVSWSVRITDGSMNTGIANPPAVVVPSDARGTPRSGASRCAPPG
jgi:hypothetical protein